jgi:F-type H+-transporting ATPase subunit b
MKFAPFPVLMAASFAVLPSVSAFAGEEKKGGFPQLDPTWMPGELFWLAVFFGLLFVLMRFVALPAVAETQGKRQQLLDSEMNGAKALAEKSEQVFSSYNNLLVDARKMAYEHLDGATIAAENEAAAKRSELQEKLDHQMEAAERDILSARDKALHEGQAIVDDLAAAIVAKVTG